MIKNISILVTQLYIVILVLRLIKNINSEVIKYFKTLKKQNIEGINNLTPSYNKLIISYDLKQTNFTKVSKKIVENLIH